MKNPINVLLVALVCSLFFSSSVPVYAASEQTYTPVIPDFLTVGNGVSIKPALNTMGDDVKAFFNDYYSNAYLTVLKQGTHTDYYPLGAPRPLYVGEDKKWSISFIKPNLKTSQGLMFKVFDPAKHEQTTAHPIGVNSILSNFDILTYNYDYASKSFGLPIISKHTSDNPFYFSYVIDSSYLSQPVSTYPYYSKLIDKPFTVDAYQVDKPISTSYYNWWIGKKRTNASDTTGQIKPPLGVAPEPPPTSSGGGSSSSNPTSSGGGSSSSNPTSSGGGSSSSNPTSSGGGSSSSSPTSSGGGLVPKYYMYHVLEGDPNKIDIIPPYIYDKIFSSSFSDQTIVQYNPPDIPGYTIVGPKLLKFCINYYSVDERDSYAYFFYKKDGSASSEPTSSDTSDEEKPDPNDPNIGLVTFTIRYYAIKENGNKVPLVVNPPHSYKKITAPNNTKFYHTPPYVQGYKPQKKEYDWIVKEGREVEVIYYPSDSSDVDNPDNETFFPILPFDPWEDKFVSNTKDPWNGFDIYEDMFEGMFKPKPVDIPESLEKPSVSSDPFSSPIIPPGSLPDIGSPTVSNPFELDSPTVSNPFEIDTPTVSNPFELDSPTVSNPFEMDSPTVSNPFQINTPTVSNPFEMDTPTVSNPFEMDTPTVSNPFELNIPIVSNPFER